MPGCSLAPVHSMSLHFMAGYWRALGRPDQCWCIHQCVGFASVNCNCCSNVFCSRVSLPAGLQVYIVSTFDTLTHSKQYTHRDNKRGLPVLYTLCPCDHIPNAPALDSSDTVAEHGPNTPLHQAVTILLHCRCLHSQHMLPSCPGTSLYVLLMVPRCSLHNQ